MIAIGSKASCLYTFSDRWSSGVGVSLITTAAMITSVRISRLDNYVAGEDIPQILTTLLLVVRLFLNLPL